MSATEPLPRRAPLQFGLRSLLVVTAVCGLLLCVFRLASVAAQMMALGVMTLVGLHLLAAAVATKSQQEAARDAGSQAVPKRMLAHSPARPTEHRLFDRRAVHGVMSLVITAASAIGAGTAGGMALEHFAHVNLAGLAVGASSSGLLGGLFGFLFASFLSVSVRSLYDAARERRSPQ